MKPFALTLALTLAASSASAQIVVDRAVRAPSAELAPAVEGPLPVPDAPAVPPALAPRVAAMRAVVEQTRECFTYRSERDEHIADRRCPGWFAALHRGGAASAHAIGALLEDDFHNQEIDYANLGDGESTVRPRIIRLMTAADRGAAAAYLVRYVARAAEVDRGLDTETARAALDTLAALAGEDLTRVAPWEDSSAALVDRARMTAAVQRWLRWHRDAASLARPAALALAQRRNVEALASADPAERWGAIQRLMAVPSQRAAAVASLREMLADAGLSAAARGWATRWARRQGVAVPSRLAAR